MRNLAIKLISVFVIFLFCLSPLGAIDSNQGNNVSHLNDNNCTDLNITNDTIKYNHSAMEKKSVYETVDDLDNDESNVDIWNISSNDSDSNSHKLGYTSEFDPALRMSVDDISCGETAIVKLWISSEEIGYLYPVTVTITDIGYSKEFTVNVSRYKGVNKLEVSDLPAGIYVVTATYPGSSSGINPTKIVRSFAVKKKPVHLKAYIDDIEVGQRAILRVTSDEGLDGNITITSNFTKPFTFPAYPAVNDELARNLTPGNYSCIVSYSGDATHQPAMIMKFFTVYKHDPNFSVETGDIVQGDKIFIKFHANKALNCNVEYRIMPYPSNSGSSLKEGSDKTIRLVKGEANASLDNILSPGRYFVYAKCVGDDSFNETVTTAEFKVNPAN